MRTNVTISVDEGLMRKCRENGLKISAICEKALNNALDINIRLNSACYALQDIAKEAVAMGYGLSAMAEVDSFDGHLRLQVFGYLPEKPAQE